MKQLFLIVALAINFCTYSQDDKTVTLVVSGQGKTQNEAKQNALRSAIEQAFGTFISSKTEILNDDLVKDEIVSVANGNIQKFEIISEVQIPNGDYATTLKATVSVTKLTSFAESKGFEVEFKGSLFGANLKQQKMNEDAELNAIINLCRVSNEILANSLDFSLKVGDPYMAKDLHGTKPNDYAILLTVDITPNSNFDKFVEYFWANIKSLAMRNSEIENYKSMNKDVYTLDIIDYHTLSFRKKETAIALQNLFIKSNRYLHSFRVISNIDTINVKPCCYYYGRGQEGSSQNIYSYQYGGNRIWELNSDSSKSYSKLAEGSSNGNMGYPQFTLVWDAGGRGEKISNWTLYFKYVHWLTNHQIFFDDKTYFMNDGKFYIENGKPSSDHLRSAPYKWFPGTESVFDPVLPIGELNFSKIVYHCKYLAIYSEKEISKITTLKVERI